jgi:hypothetical protein
MNGRFRILTLVPQPVDAGWVLAAAATWDAIDQCLRPQVDRGVIEIVRLAPVTANALEERLRRESFHAIHVVSRGTSRPAARQGTVTLEATDGRAREVNAQTVARLCALNPALSVAVLQVAGGSMTEFDVLRDTLAEQTVSVVCVASDLPGSSAALYSSLASGQPLQEAFGATGLRPGEGLLSLHLKRGATTHLPATPPVEPVVLPETRHADRQPDTEPEPDRAATVAAQEVERKRAASAFDVFLCHNVGDKPAVMDIGRRLMTRGVLPWLDRWELRPGMPWQRSLEEQIANIRAAAVFVGQGGIGPWQRQELDGFLREFNTRGCPVIPVMLPGDGGKEPELPLFLRGMTWVDFRIPDPDPLSQLIWGITGRRPA